MSHGLNIEHLASEQHFLESKALFTLSAVVNAEQPPDTKTLDAAVVKLEKSLGKVAKVLIDKC